MIAFLFGSKKEKAEAEAEMVTEWVECRHCGYEIHVSEAILDKDSQFVHPNRSCQKPLPAHLTGQPRILRKKVQVSEI